MPRSSSRLADELGEALRAARDKPLGAVARDAGVTRNALLELETGRRGDGEPSNPTLARVERVADAYGLRVRIITEPKQEARP